MSGEASRYRIRWEADRLGTAAGRVMASADRGRRAVTLTMPGEQVATLDVVAARAASMLLAEVVYGVLEPDGPFLAIEAARGGHWVGLREVRR